MKQNACFKMMVIASFYFIYTGSGSLHASETPSEAQPSHASGVRLEELTQEALSKNPAIRAKKAQYEASRAKVIDAWMPSDPMASAEVQGQSAAAPTHKFPPREKSK